MIAYLANGSVCAQHQGAMEMGVTENIKGLDIALKRMREGTFAKAWIPSKLAYGVHGSPPIVPPNADLTLEITLFKIIH